MKGSIYVKISVKSYPVIGPVAANCSRSEAAGRVHAGAGEGDLRGVNQKYLVTTYKVLSLPI